MIDLLLVESLACVTGIWPKGDHPTENDVIAASGYLATLSARLKRWLRAPDAEDYQPRPFEFSEPPEEKKLQDRILKPIEGDELTRMLSVPVDVETAQAYVEMIRADRAYLDSKWPKVPTPGIPAGVFPLSQEELADVWTLARILDDPTVLFDELEAGSLTIPMVDAWRERRPLLAAKVDADIADLVVERLASKKSLTWQQSDLIRMLGGIPLDAIVEIPVEKPQRGAQP